MVFRLKLGTTIAPELFDTLEPEDVQFMFCGPLYVMAQVSTSMETLLGEPFLEWKIKKMSAIATLKFKNCWN